MNDKLRLSPERRAALRLLAADPLPGMRSIKGSVTIDGQPAQPGQRVGPGQTVRTEAGAEAIYVIGDDAFLQHENSEFTTGTSAGVVALRYLTGRVLSVFGRGKKRLETPTATIGIRGTACYIEAEAAQTYFCLCYGTAVVAATANPRAQRTVRTKHHESPFYIDRMGEAMMRRAEVVNHTDDELIILEALVGRRPPFYGKGYPAH